MYRQALSLMTADNDSLMVSLQAEMKQIPDGYYHHSDGKSYPYRLLPDNKAVLTGQGPWFATHLEGTVELPSFIVAAGRADTVVGLDEFAFGRNRKLYKVTLPQHCRYIGTDAFKGCDSLTLVVNPELEVVHSTKVSETIPADAIILIPKIRINVKNVSKLVRDYIAAEKLLPKPSDDHIFDRNLKSDRIGRMLQNAIRQDNNFSRYADLVCRVAKVEYKELPQWDNFRVVDYEELVSIGILAVQVLIKNKTPEQLANYNDLYIATAVTWAIQNELKIRYEWYEYLLGEYLVDVLSYDLAKQYGTAGIDYQIGQVRLACYKVLAQVGSTYGELSDSVAEGGSGAGESELQKMWRLVKGCRDKMPGKYLECYDAFFTPDADYINIQYRYSPVIIQGMFNEIKAILNDAGMHGF